MVYEEGILLLEAGMETSVGGGARRAVNAEENGGRGTAPGGGPDGSAGPGPEPCDLVTVPTRQGLEAVDILRRTAAPAVGPVLHDGTCDTLGFLVPPGTADGWDVPGSACTETPRPDGGGWLLPPEGAERVTDPVVLREALGEAARLIEAVDRCS